MVDNIIKLQIIGQFDHYDFKGSKQKIWFKNLTTNIAVPKTDEECNQTYIGKAFIKQNDAPNLIGGLTYEDKVLFDAEILLNIDNEYEITYPVKILKMDSN